MSERKDTRKDTEGHVLVHLPPCLREWAMDIATTVDTFEVIARRRNYADAEAMRSAYAIRQMLGIPMEQRYGSLWRLKLVRLYYGIDPCWCEETMG